MEALPPLTLPSASRDARARCRGTGAPISCSPCRKARAQSVRRNTHTAVRVGPAADHRLGRRQDPLASPLLLFARAASSEGRLGFAPRMWPGSASVLLRLLP